MSIGGRDEDVIRWALRSLGLTVVSSSQLVSGTDRRLTSRLDRHRVPLSTY